MEQNHTPLYDAMLNHGKSKPLSLHVPGHKNGTVFPAKGQRFRDLLPLDLTELSGLDDLHSASGVIRKAQQLLSSLYESEQSWFLVGGSTVGNLAMVCSACHKGGRVLVQRNCHRSVLNAIELAGAKPVFMAPDIDEKSGIATVPSMETIERALMEFPDACSLIVTHPNYYGMSANLRALIDLAHRRNIPVLVDEAHGAHFVLGKPFPEAALQCGADAVVQSAHKTLPAMTMGAFLHVQGERIDLEKIGYWLGLLQSSSPSYPIMGSLDLARFYLAQLTEKDIESIWLDTQRTRNRLKSLQGISVVEPCNSSAYETIDPLKITLQTDPSLSGFEWARKLESLGIYPELADPRHVLLVLPLARFDESKLISTVKKTIPLLSSAPRQSHGFGIMEFPQLSCPENIESLSTVRISLDKAAGAVSAEEVTPYPPGVPVILRGERITASQLNLLRQWHDAGGRFQSGHDVISKGIHVFAESNSG